DDAHLRDRPPVLSCFSWTPLVGLIHDVPRSLWMAIWASRIFGLVVSPAATAFLVTTRDNRTGGWISWMPLLGGAALATFAISKLCGRPAANALALAAASLVLIFPYIFVLLLVALGGCGARRDAPCIS